MPSPSAGKAARKPTRSASRKRATSKTAAISERAASAADGPSRSIDTFVNPNPGRDYLIHIEIPEFTCHCPLTGQPDFATIELDYIADKRNVELKALKLYMWSYRDQNAFHEACTNQILEDLVAVCKPRFMRVTARWYVRGGIYTTVLAEHTKRGFKLQAPANLALFPRESPVR